MAYSPTLQDLPDESNSGYSPSLEDIPQENQVSQMQRSDDPSFAKKLIPNLVGGLATMGNKIINFPHTLAENAPEDSVFARMGNKGSDVPSYKPGYDYYGALGLPKSATFADKIVRGLAQYAPSLAAPEADLGVAGTLLSKIPGVGSLVSRGLSLGTPQAAFGATQSDSPSQGVEEGLALGAGGAGIEKALNVLRPSSILRGRLPASELKNNLEAAQGTNTSLGDVIGSPLLKKLYENTLTAVPGSGAVDALHTTGQQVIDRGNSLLSKMLGKNDPDTVPAKLTETLMKAFKDHHDIKNSMYDKTNKIADSANLNLSLPTFSKNASKYMDAIESTNMLKYDPDAKTIMSKLVNYKNPVVQTRNVGSIIGNDGKPLIDETKLKYPTLKEANILKGKLKTQSEAFKVSPDPAQRGIGAVLGKLSSSLKKDIETSIAKSGNNNLKVSYDNAEKNYADKFSPFLDKDIYKFVSGNADPETLIHKFITTSTTKDLSGKIQKISRNLPSQQSKDLLSYGYFSRALDNEGNLNPTNLATAIRKLGKNQFKELVPSVAMRKDLSNFSNLSRMNKEAQYLMLNPHTGQRNLSPMVAALAAHLAGGAYGSHEGGPLGGIAGLIAPSFAARGATKLLTSPGLRNKIVKSMLDNKKIKLSGATLGGANSLLNQGNQ